MSEITIIIFLVHIAHPYWSVSSCVSTCSQSVNPLLQESADFFSPKMSNYLKPSTLWSRPVAPVPHDITGDISAYPNKQEVCLPAVPHRSTLSVCSKGLLPYCDSLWQTERKRGGVIKDCCVMFESITLFKCSHQQESNNVGKKAA